MANQEHTLGYIPKGRNPYYCLKTPYYIGTDTLQIWGGKYLDMELVWEIIWLQLNINTDATVANRIGRIYIRSPFGASGALASPKTPNIPASQTDYNLEINGISYADATVDLSEVEAKVGYGRALPLIGDLGNIYCDLYNGQAGDTWRLNMLLKLKNHELGMFPTGQPIPNGGVIIPPSFPEGTKWD